MSATSTNSSAAKAKSAVSKPNTPKATAAKPASVSLAKPIVKSPVKTVNAVKTSSAAKPAVHAAPKPATKAVVKTALPLKPTLNPTLSPKLSPKLNNGKKDDNKHSKNHKNDNDKKDDKKVKLEKVKMERDSFTMPKDEYAQLALLKSRLTSMGQPAKKSELLRAGVKLLAAMSDSMLKTTLAKVPVIKTGRPNH